MEEPQVLVRANSVVVSPPKESPMIECQERFSVHDSIGLAAGSRELLKLLDTLPPSLKNAYRLELNLVGPYSGVLRLCLSPLDWYDDLLPQYEKEEGKRFNIAKQYVQDARVQGKQLWGSDTPPIAIRNNQPVCRSGSKSACTNTMCSAKHPKWVCSQQVSHKLGGSRECGFTIYEENVLPTTEPSVGWTLYTRPCDCTREVLLMPEPDAIVHNAVPHGNDGMVQSLHFWQTISRGYSLLNSMIVASSSSGPINHVTRVVVNFGQWESAMRADSFLAECHAHAHFWLTPEFVRNCSALDLRRYDFPPEDYVLINALDLERNRLYFQRVESLDTRMTAMETSMTAMKGEMTTMKEEMTTMNTTLTQILNLSNLGNDR